MDPAAPQEMTAVRIIEHKEALEIAQRLINSAFGNDNRARFSIPCRPHHDDDCLIMAYIAQREMERNRLTAAETARAAAEAEAARLRAALNLHAPACHICSTRSRVHSAFCSAVGDPADRALAALTKEPSHGK